MSKQRLACWHCNAPINRFSDGWVCTQCGQHGSNHRPVDTWQDGAVVNRPYVLTIPEPKGQDHEKLDPKEVRLRDH